MAFDGVMLAIYWNDALVDHDFRWKHPLTVIPAEVILLSGVHRKRGPVICLSPELSRSKTPPTH